MLASLVGAAQALLGRLHHWKNRHQFLARYSIEKLVIFHEYQRDAPALRVALVLLLSPLPVLVVLLVVDLLPLGDPLAGARHNTPSFLRSAFSHAMIAVSTMLSLGASLRLSRSQLSLRRIAVIGSLVGVFGELAWLPLAFFWRYPIPFRELMNVPLFALLLAFFVWLLARPVVHRLLQSQESRRRLNNVLQVAGLQLGLFYAGLGVAVGFAHVSLIWQIVLVLTVPIVKVGCKRLVWRFAHQYTDLTTEITVCIVEMAAALFQTVSFQDQARVLEQSLQLLFSCEVLLFAELIEMFVPLVYAVYIAVAWQLPNASYSLILMTMSKDEMLATVTSALVFSTLELLSFLGLCWVMQRKYGISVFHLLTFVLEKYWASLYGKLIGCFVTILMSATLHQGIDWSFEFDYKALVAAAGQAH
ncbi:hypothetical protein P43SY_003066 [Pythium insidiosum]|uniref:Transmembrane protein n=1 Tax=Pythium insidiosum TaxID=114742 RepID=A0AAD5Q6U8_PYTIN|nr:hypothetical protein P43SY_003066 [Pythium insidiosum]